MDETIRWKPTDYEVVTDWEGTTFVRRSDGASIPCDPRNADYYEFLQVEKADKAEEIKRTTIPKPVAEKSQLELIEARLATIETKVDTIIKSTKDLR